MQNHILNPDTQATLLLCGRFGKVQTSGATPLTLREFNSMGRWLRDRGKRPADLVEESIQNALDNEQPPVPAVRLRELLERGVALAFAVEAWDNNGLWVISRYDDVYPQRLKALKALSPPILYGAGDISLLSKGGFAIVGSRDADEDTLTFTKDVASVCAEQCIQVVSGGARGVDTEAMTAALDRGGTAVGVLPDSLGKATLSKRYREAILEKSLVLLSPHDPESGFNVGNAMARNKYIYALADIGLVVNCSLSKGGTWAGAIETLKEQHLYVRADEHMSEGNRKLLDIGAIPFPGKPWTDLSVLLQTNKLDSPAPVADKVELPPIPDRQRFDTAFDAVLPLLLSFLSQPDDVKSLAKRLDVRTEQVKDWLQKAEERGDVVKEAVRKGRTAYYVAKQHASNLFTASGMSNI